MVSPWSRGRYDSTHLCLVRGVTVQPRSIQAVLVRSGIAGRCLVVERPEAVAKLGLRLHNALMDLEEASVTRIYLANITPRPVNVPKGFTIGHVELYDGPAVAVPAEGEQPLEEGAAETCAALDSLSTEAKVDAEGSAPTGPTSAESEAKPEPDVAWSRIAPDLQARVRSLLERFKSLWTGSLGRVNVTPHRITLQPNARPVRAQPYRAGPHSRQLIAD
ncbi:hypothetical protein MMPV_005878 [Pyropia vietnamensis]